MNRSNEHLGACRSTNLQELAVNSGLAPLDMASLSKFDAYLDLILRWNARTNLTGIRDADGILQRHFLESIICARALPAGIATLLDFGSGAGFPGVPIAICRPEIAVTLAESQNKKAAFLREVASALKIPATVFGGRAEKITQSFDCVTLRAVDRMEEAVAFSASLVGSGGLLALMTTVVEFQRLSELVPGFKWRGDDFLLPGSEQRILRFGIKS